ncbi:MAG: hypothetical protein HKL98_06030 [Burkholderiales bacterium]|nr:hypothetical protein [Burkholderiales bacterium]
MNAEKPPGSKQALVIIGMHRSGTSATTGALRCLGVDLGNRLYKGHEGINDKGYFEHSDLADANDEALSALGSSWDDILLRQENWWKREELIPFAARIRSHIRKDFANSSIWAVKDPRVCRLLPWWLEIFDSERISPRFIFVIRSPHAVFRSLERRDGFSMEKSFLLWSLHYLEAEQWSRNFPRAFVDFDRFIEHPAQELARVEETLGISFPISVENAAPCLNQFLSRDLRHHQERESPESSPVLSLTHALHQSLLGAVDSGQPDSLEMDALWNKMESIQSGFPRALVEHIRSSGSIQGNLQITMNRLMRSWSWYTGKPVRFLERLAGRNV